MRLEMMATAIIITMVTTITIMIMIMIITVAIMNMMTTTTPRTVASIMARASPACMCRA